MGYLTKKGQSAHHQLIEVCSEPRLTWLLLVEVCKTKLRISRAQQSLMTLRAVDMAMKGCRAALKAPTEKLGWIKDIHQANEHIEKLTVANQQLKTISQ